MGSPGITMSMETSVVLTLGLFISLVDIVVAKNIVYFKNHRGGTPVEDSV